MSIKGLLKGIYILSAIGAVGCLGTSLYYEHKMREARKQIIRKKAAREYAENTTEIDDLEVEIEDLERNIKKYNKKQDNVLFLGMTCCAVGALALVGSANIRCDELATKCSARLRLLDKQYQLSAKYIPENKWMKFNGDILKLYEAAGKGAAVDFNPGSHPEVLMEGFTLRRSLYA